MNLGVSVRKARVWLDSRCFIHVPLGLALIPQRSQKEMPPGRPRSDLMQGLLNFALDIETLKGPNRSYGRERTTDASSYTRDYCAPLRLEGRD